MPRLIINIFSATLLCIFWALSVAAAPLTDPARVRWEHTGGFVMKARRWEEKTGNSVYSLVETARNSVFVELFDPGRGYTIRLYDSKMLIRGGNGTAGKKILKFTKQAEGKWEDGPAKTQWAYPEGSLKTDGEAWFEPVSHEVNMFMERARTAEFVELHDSLRDYTIRLSAAAMQIRGGKFKDFTKIHEGRWTAVAGPAQIRMTPDVSEAPGARDWALAAKELAERWYPIVTERLHPNASPAPRSYKLTFKNAMDHPATTVTGATRRMDINAAWIAKHPDDWGMVIHELTHAIQEYNLQKTQHAGWLAEGIADYVRYFEFEPEKPLAPSPNKTYRDGYRTAAAFLNWVARTYDARLIEKLHAHLQADTYTDNVFMELTGRPLDRLWTEFQEQ
jgi:Peptidase of plants and bacteria